jgi:hypothetical protein
VLTGSLCIGAVGDLAGSDARATNMFCFFVQKRLLFSSEENLAALMYRQVQQTTLTKD